MPVANEIGQIQTVAELVFTLSIELPEPMAQQFGYLAQQLKRHAEATVQILRDFPSAPLLPPAA